MREIKFRAWDERRWRYLNIDEFESMSPQWDGYVNTGRYGYGLMMEVSDGEYVLEPYTGLKDKYGKDIYEGDILRTVDGFRNYPGEVKFGKCMINSEYECWGFYMTQPFNDELLTPDQIYEVIGNVHENPELIES